MESVADQPDPGPDTQTTSFDHLFLPIETLEGGMVIQLSGDISSDDVKSFNDLTDTIVRADSPGGERSPKLILDCTGLQRLSGTTIGAFANLQRRLRKHGGNLVLLNLQDPEKEWLRLLGFSELITVTTELEKAISHLAAPSETSPAVLFPHVLDCPSCTAKLRSVKPGRFRCSSCQAVLAINYGAQVFAA